MISVVIPMYNASKIIIECLQSVLQQTYKGNTEIIIVNDGSTDGSLDLVINYCKTNELKNVITIDKDNGGVSTARNEGMRISKGEFIAFLDADDVWLPHKIETQLSIFKENTEIDFLASTIFDPGKENSGRLKIIPLKYLIFKNYFQPSTVIMKRKIYESIGEFNEIQRYAEEGNYFMRVASRFRCVLLYEKLIIYGNGKSGFGHSGLSANLLEMERGEMMNLRYAYNNKLITRGIFYVAICFSVLKYLRRILIVKMRKV